MMTYDDDDNDDVWCMMTLKIIMYNAWCMMYDDVDVWCMYNDDDGDDDDDDDDDVWWLWW